MIKGIQKQMVMVNTKGSEHFEAAYFVLRDGIEEDGCDIISEANSIVARALPSSKKRADRRGTKLRARVATFFIGLVIGALISAAFLTFIHRI